MLKQTKKLVIHNQNYEIGQFPAMHNINLFIKCNAVVGCSFGNILGAIDLQSTNIDLSKIGNAISEFMTALYKNDSKNELILEIMSQTMRNGKAINKSNFDEFYTGNVEEFIEALVQSVVSHFSPFLPMDLISGFLKAPESLEKMDEDSVL